MKTITITQDTFRNIAIALIFTMMIVIVPWVKHPIWAWKQGNMVLFIFDSAIYALMISTIVLWLRLLLRIYRSAV